MAKSKVLVVGGTGYIGRRIVRASLEQGHPTYVLQRAEIGLDIEKLHLLLSFKKQGARLVQGSFSDQQSLVEAVKKVDVVICTMSGVHFKSHSILMQLKLVDAIKEAGNVKESWPVQSSPIFPSNPYMVATRFLPSEFGMDPSKMEHALAPGRETFDQKMIVRKAIEDANIPLHLETLIPPKDKVRIYGDGNAKVVYMDEDDIATYAIKAIDDPRTLNRTLYLRPPENVLSQGQLVEIWERLSGKKLEKIYIPGEDFLASMKGMDYVAQAGMGHFYHIFYEGCLTNFEIGEDGEEASNLYPEVKYTRMDEYLKIFL
ncbi:hypothetical protein OIU76_004244 [Salix suchowensis]|nr:hypothetical protein OIU76_004244 [Salix suchowensis]